MNTKTEVTVKVRMNTKTEVKYITEVTVTDPDQPGTPVQVTIYKDLTSGAMFGLDSRFEGNS